MLSFRQAGYSILQYLGNGMPAGSIAVLLVETEGWLIECPHIEADFGGSVLAAPGFSLLQK